MTTAPRFAPRPPRLRDVILNSVSILQYVAGFTLARGACFNQESRKTGRNGAARPALRPPRLRDVISNSVSILQYVAGVHTRARGARWGAAVPASRRCLARAIPWQSHAEQVRAARPLAAAAGARDCAPPAVAGARGAPQRSTPPATTGCPAARRACAPGEDASRAGSRRFHPSRKQSLLAGGGGAGACAPSHRLRSGL